MGGGGLSVLGLGTKSARLVSAGGAGGGVRARGWVGLFIRGRNFIVCCSDVVSCELGDL